MALLAAHFQQLPNPAARRAALNGIVESLTTAEWRELLGRLQQRDFRRDIVGSLPVEIVATIFHHLPPSAPFRYQLVSRRWRHVLSSTHVTGAALEDWYSAGDPKLVAEETEQTPDAYQVHAWKAAHFKRFQEGEPYHSVIYSGNWKARFSGKSTPGAVFGSDTDFVKDTIAWIEGRRVVAHNLRRRQPHFAVGDGREEINYMKLTEGLIAFIALSSRRVYVYDLDTQDKVHFTLENRNVDAFAAQGKTVVVASVRSGVLNGRAQGNDRARSPQLNVYVWSADDHRTRSFIIDRLQYPLGDYKSEPCVFMPRCVVVDEATCSIAFFYCAASDDGYTVMFERWSFDGVFLTRQKLHYPVVTFLLQEAEARPMDYEGRIYHIKARVKPYIVEGQLIEGEVLASIIFDNKRDRLFIKDSGCGFPASIYESFGNIRFDRFKMFRWKDAVYYMPPTTAGTLGPQTYQTLMRYEQHLGIMEIPEFTAYQSADARDEEVLGNEHMLVLVRRGHCVVWCFDAHLKLPKRIDAN